VSILQKALIAKSGYDCGFEHVPSETATGLILASPRHSAQLEVRIAGTAFNARVVKGNALLVSELRRHFPGKNNQFQCESSKHLRFLLRRAAELAQSLPNQAKVDFENAVASKLEKLPDVVKGTEVERMVRQRIGQQTFRAAMLDYWGGACAVTGIALPEVLRASHAKPWAACDTDAERLNVFNGFLLSANLDALFDRFLISFDDNGTLLVSVALANQHVEGLGLARPLRLRWLAEEHTQYLRYHRARFSEALAEGRSS